MKATLLSLTACGLAAVFSTIVTAQSQTPRFRQELTVKSGTVGGSASDDILTFSGPFSVPGVSLPAGTYVFSHPTEHQGQVLRVMSHDKHQVYATVLTIATSRARSTDDIQVVFSEGAAGSPPRVKAWFLPGELRGSELVYTQRAPTESQPQVATN